MRAFHLTSILFVVLLTQSCNEKGECMRCNSPVEPRSLEEVNGLLDSLKMSLNIDYPHVEFPENLYEKIEFNKLVADLCNTKSILIEIVLRDTSSLKREISLLVLQHFCLEDYLSLTKSLYSSYKNGKLEKHYFLFSIQTRLSNVLVENYQDKELRKFIDILIKDESFSKSEKEYFKKMLSGDILNGIKNSPPS